MTSRESEYAVIGGGVVGLSIAHRLLTRGCSVTVYDEGDGAFRASRGNFGLVWVQSKGLSEPRYAQWSRRAVADWRGFAASLQEQSGLDLALSQKGGFIIHLDEAALEADAKAYRALRERLGGDYPFEVLGHNALKAEEPEIGPQVAGALYCPEDGHVNPLRLLQALAISVRRLGAQVRTRCKVSDVTADGDGFLVETATGQLRHGKVVLAAGLGAMELGPKLGFKTPIRPQQGQVLITEKLPKILNYPNVEIRQVNEGGVQIGASKAEIGPDDRETVATVAELAAHAVRMFPILERARLVRSWAALRIMSPDGLPIYQRSETHPGATFVTCHSGITLASVHAGVVADWIMGADAAPEMTAFSEERF